MSYLYEKLLSEFGARTIKQTLVPSYISDNLKPGYGERPYQIESFQRFILCYNEEFEAKPKKPLHLLYNMATGSGKTLVMAGLMLYLYEKGYRNFLFFVNSNNIIQKTKENFLNPTASKYLFNNKIVIDGKEVYIKETETFESADDNNINIKFTTIQSLHSDLTSTKENSITYEDFENKKIVLLADEAHHLNAGTKSGNLFGSWEDTVKKIHDSNLYNILLEFTATLDSASAEIEKKYEDKVIYKYDLAQFRKDKFSKEINLLRSEFGEKNRIIQALILNQYRQELAAKNGINLKPVILFKAKQTIKESEQNKENFHKLIDELDSIHIEQIKTDSTIPIIAKAFSFFTSHKFTVSEIANRIKSNFKIENCISANNDAEAEKNQILLNTLEDENNPIRAVFAVQKLNEGWDVLNLYDIVRLYEGQNSGGSNKTIGKTTLAEAQLIGRGARYFPFALETGQDKYTRKYDDDQTNDLKILEELYYHAKDDSRYISELKTALIATGIYQEDDTNLVTKQLQLKFDFKETDFYKTGSVVFNKKVPKSYENIKSIAALGVSRHNFLYTISSGSGSISSVFSEEKATTYDKKEVKEIKLSQIPRHIVRYALAQNPFFYFSSLIRYFPSLGSISNFIESDDYLGNLEITLSGTKTKLENITNADYLLAVQGLLQSIETEIKSNLTDFEGSDYTHEYINHIFKDKEIKVPYGSERAYGQEELVANEPWYAYNANYGTSEEKKFVSFFSNRVKVLENKFENIYLIRNERTLKIFDKQGRAFEPDFLLFCKQKGGEELTYQLFIEPKGEHLNGFDKWKEDFLIEIRNEERTIKIDADNYLITGIPFYNFNSENEFKNELEGVLGV